MLSIGATDAPDVAQTLAVFQTQDALFAENAGQWANEDVHFGYNKDGARIYFTDETIEFGLSRRELTSALESDILDASETLTPEMEEETHEYASTHFSLRFLGAHATAPTGADMAETIFNYHLGDSATWVDGVATYKTVVYQDLYDGVDLHAFSQSGQMKYEFHVASGGDWSQITLGYDGIQGLSIAPDGSLRIATELGEIVDENLYIYQTIDGQQVEVAGHFTLIDQDTYTFTVTGEYDPSEELVIDPDITWGTYLGGSGMDFGNGIAVDSSGNILVTGETASSGWTSGAYDTSYNGGNFDAFVVKISSSGAHLWSTYLGGNNDDYGNGIVVDSSGNVLVTGNTFSSGWTSGGRDTTYNGYSDAFVVKLNSNGWHAWSTYLGGPKTDYGFGIAVDAARNILVTGGTTSSDWTSGGYDTSYNGSFDLFVVKLTSSGLHVWSTYLGGDMGEYGYGIAVDSLSNVYVGGGAVDTTDARGLVAKFSASGAWSWTTYLGGSSYDVVMGIAVDSSRNVLVTGRTDSSGWTSGGWDTSYNGGDDAFVAKLNSSGSHLWSTYLGGGGCDAARGLAVDSAGNVLVTGRSDSAGWTLRGCDTSHNGGYDVFVAKFSPTGTHLWSSYLGGGFNDYGEGIAVASSGSVLVTGRTDSDGWTFGGYDTSFAGVDGFVVRIETGLSSLIVADAGGPYTVNEGTVCTLNAAATYDPTGAIASCAWDLDNDGQYDDATGVTTTFGRTADGVYTVRVKVTDDDGRYDIETTTVTVNNVAPTAEAGGPYSVNEGSTVTLRANYSTDPGNDITSYAWDLDNDGQFDDATGVTTAFSRTADGVYTVRLKVTDDDGGYGIDTVIVTVNNVLPTANAGGPYSVNEGDAVTLSAARSTDPGNDITSYAWDLDNDGQFDDATGVTTAFSRTADGVYTVRLKVTDDDGGSRMDTTTVTVNNVAPTADAGGPYECNFGSAVTLDASGSTDPGMDIVDYAWDTDGDGQYDDLFGATVEYTPPTPGAFVVAVRVADDDGYTGSDGASIQVVALELLLGDANNDGMVDDQDASIMAAHWRQQGGWADGDFNNDNMVNEKDASILASHWHQAAPGMLLGDANCDGTVDDQDASILAAHWKKSGGWLDGDFNNDGMVNEKDASILASHWGQSVEGQSPAAVVDAPVDVPVETVVVGPRRVSAGSGMRRRIEPCPMGERGKSGVVEAAALESESTLSSAAIAAAHDVVLAESLDAGELASYRLGAPSVSAQPRRRLLTPPDAAATLALDLALMGE